MTQETTTLTGNDVQAARILALSKMLRLEIQGMRRRGKSAYLLVKEEFGFKGNRQSVLEQLETWIDENIWEKEE